ncbi:MAG: class I SAM-dependent methyltransferase [Planctomycetes bacterium]|nr:class I SAM-dependent methyltransferase [Planctomycetota bacterium]
MPLLRQLIRPLRRAWTRVNEAWLNIDTVPAMGAWSHARDGQAEAIAGARTDAAQFDDNMRYESPDYWYVRKACRDAWHGRRNAREIAYDLGSGMGRVLCVLALRPWAKVVGVELFADLAASSRQNAAAMRGRRAPIEVITGDALQQDLGDGTVFFLFNPFGAKTLAGVLARIDASLRTNPRHVQFLYYNAEHDQVVADSGLFERWHHFQTRNGVPVSYWRTR